MGIWPTVSVPPPRQLALKLRSLFVAAALLCATRATARAEEKDPELPTAPNLPGPDEAEEDRMALLQQQVAELSERIKEAEDARAKSVSPLTIHGYVDFGFFAPIGNHGIGFIEDVGNRQTPQFNRFAWTFLGDILSTAVNSRGEVANLGNSTEPGVNRFDSVDSGGAPGFLVNEVNLRLGYALSDRAVMRTSVNFVPRSGHDFALGDFVDVDLAEMEYVVTDDGNTSIFAGKIMPVLGIEYKERKSDQRFGITPSLIQRYTSGPQLGVKVRSKLLHDWFIVAASATNNSSGTEQFHFQSEIDKNSGKTLNGRLAISIPIAALMHATSGERLEFGASGEWGAQDWAPDTSGKFAVLGGDVGKIWFVGGDVQFLGTNYALKGQILRGKAPGTIDGTAWSLDLHLSGYLEFDWQALAHLGFIARVEQRDAVVAQALDHVYLTKERRLTVGARAVLNSHMMLKAEYLYNREYGGIAQFRNDMFTSSLVLAY